MVRDYIPVSYVVRALLTARDCDCGPGLHIFNVSSGLRITNGEVYEIVQSALARNGFRIRAEWAPCGAPGEAEHIILDPESMWQGLGMEPPRMEEIVAAIEATVDDGVNHRLAVAAAVTGS